MSTVIFEPGCQSYPPNSSENVYSQDLLCAAWANDSNQFDQFLNSLEMNNTDIVQEADLDLDSRDLRSFSALHYTCANGNIEMTEALLSKGCSIDIADKNGNTALLFLASQQATTDNDSYNHLLISLIESGANPNIQNFQGESPLHLACLNGNSSMIRFLVENGANLNCKNLEGSTPLHIAVASGNTSLVGYLLEHGAFVNAQDDEGDSPLHYAVRDSQSEVIQLLVSKYKASVDLRNEDEESSIDLARDLGEEAIANFLVQFSASWVATSSPRMVTSPQQVQKFNNNSNNSNNQQFVGFGKPSSTSNNPNCSQSKNEGSALSSFARSSAWVHVHN